MNAPADRRHRLHRDVRNSNTLRPRQLAWASLLLLGAGSLGGCGSPSTLPGDDAPTLKSLAGQAAPAPARSRLPTSEEQALRAWRELLAAQPDPRQRAQALRRLGDLEMDRTDAALAADPGASAATVASAASSPNGAPDYRAAIKSYQTYLAAYPQDPGNDRVLYQLARAHEQGGDLETALKVLDQLVTRYPATRYRDEAEFRRGELLFTTRQYPAAEAAYAQVLAGAADNPFRVRALYMQGWSQFKQSRLEPALASFMGVLDGQLAGKDDGLPLEELPGLSRGDRELVEDSFRVVSLALENLQGAASIPPLVNTAARESYQVRLYQQLAALYLKQDRPKDAADTFNAFARLYPLHAQAPVLQAQVIRIHEGAGFAQLAWQAKQEFVNRYGLQGEFRRANPEAWARAQTLLKTHLADLAQQAHADAQRSKQAADVTQAVQWYQALLEAFPNDESAARNQFLLGELLVDGKRHAEATVAYERSAYDHPAHARSADAGYAALLAWGEQRKAADPASPAGLRLSQDSVASSLRFAKAFPTDPRCPPVLAYAADTLVRLGDGAQAAAVARQLLALQPPAADEPRRVALTVLATTSFEAGEFAQAEGHSQAALGLTPVTPASQAQRQQLADRLAAAIYRQGEQAREAGKAADAASLFERASAAAPQSAVRKAAQFDAATQRLALKDWPAAIRLLEDFRQRYAGDPLQAQLPAKLALAYSESGAWTPAALEFERIAQAEQASDPERSRGALWQAALLHEQALGAAASSSAAALAPTAHAPPPAAEPAKRRAGKSAPSASTSPSTNTAAAPTGPRSAATAAWERYLRAWPSPLAPAVEARARLAALARADGNRSRELAWQRELFEAERQGGEQRSASTRALAAQAALALAEPAAAAYAEVALTEPLQKSLALKKARLQDALQAYALASESGDATGVTGATFRTAELYQDFGRALMNSQRPKKLSKVELEQYNVLLEEQAFPFEEKAAEIHQSNTRRAADGVYDRWVQQSFAALRTLLPARYNKAERQDSSELPAAAANRAAIALREQGKFAEAAQAWTALQDATPPYPAAVLNLGLLHDLYLAKPAVALAQYERYLTLVPEGDAQVAKWITELKSRKEGR